MRRPPIADSTGRPPSRHHSKAQRYLSTQDLHKQAQDPSSEKLLDQTQGIKTKKCLTNIEIFRQIINERHTVMKLDQSDPYKKFAKKVITPALRNGIVTRAFSRNKLELFTRPDPSLLTMSLKNRVNSIVQNADLPAKGVRKQLASRYLTFKRYTTDQQSYELAPETERTKLRTLADQSGVTLSQSRKDLSIKDFPSERLDIKQLQDGASSKSKLSKFREQRYVSLNIRISRPSSNTSGDFFPQRYRLAAKKDSAIVSAFNQSFTSSGRNSLSRQRASELPSPQA